MPTVDKVIVELQAKVDTYNANVNNAMRNFERAEKGITTSARRMETGVVASLGRIGGAFVSVQAARKALSLIDAATNIRNSFRIAGVEGDQLSATYEKLFQVAQRNATPIEDLASLYGRAAQAADELGASSEDLIKFTDNVSKSLRLSGSDTQAAKGALTQLSQALGGARIQAEEFNAINDGARPLLQAAAAGIEQAGGSVSKLKQLVNDGKISNKAFFDGIQAGAYILDQQLDNSVLTINQRFVQFQNILVDSAGRLNDVFHISDDVGNAVDQMGEAVERFTNFLIQNKGPLKDFMDFLNANVADTGNPFKDIEKLMELFDKDKNRDKRIALLAQSLADFGNGLDESNTRKYAESIQQVILQFNSASLTATEAKAEIAKIFDGDTTNAIYQKLSSLFDELETLRGKAAEAAAAVSAAADPTGAFPRSGDFEAFTGQKLALKPPKKVDLTDYPVLGSGSKGTKKKSAAEKFDDSLQSVKDRTAALQLEAQSMGLTTKAAENLKIKQDLLNEARDAGVKMTPEVLKAIDATAEAYAAAAQKMEDLQKIEDLKGLFKDIFGGFIQDLRDGKTALEALGGALDKIADKLLDMALDAAINMLFSNLLGAIGGGGGGASGGIASVVGAVASGIFKPRANGGAIAQGGLYQTGERGIEAFAAGMAGSIIPNHRLAAAAGSHNSQGAPTFNFAPSVDARGASVEAVARLEAVLARMRAEFGPNVVRVMREARSSLNWRG